MKQNTFTKKTVMKKIVLSIIIYFTILTAYSVSGNDTLKYNNLIHKVFNQHYDYFVSYLTGEKHTRIYDIQTWTNPLMESAFALKEYSILDSLAALYLKAYPSLKEMETYYFLYNEQIDTIIFNRPMKLWTNNIKRIIDSSEVFLDEELPLNSSQFSFLLSRFIHLAIKDDECLKFNNIDSLITTYYPVLIDDHYKRWILEDYDFFQLKGWACINGRYNHKELTELRMKEKFKRKPNYCASVTDIDLWIPAGLCELLMANKIDPEKISLRDDELKKYQEYIQLMLDFIGSKLTLSELVNFKGEEVQGYNFDIKAWTDYYENEYAQNLSDSFPQKKDKKKLKQIGWDLSHARRFVTIFETLLEYHNHFNTSFPDSNDIRLFANQFIYKNFNGDFEKPLFTNYSDGTNGWYRVGYHGPGFGFAPYDMSISAVTGGFLYWSKYNPDIEKLKPALWYHVSENTDHWKRYYGRLFYEYKRTRALDLMNIKSYDSIFLLQFLPVLVY